MTAGVTQKFNYDPSAWTYSTAKLGTDFAKIAGMNANMVRVFVQPSAFGYPGTPSAAEAAKLAKVVNAAGSHGLAVHLSLFDLWDDFTHLAASESWAKAILAPYVSDPRVAVVELKNEIVPVAPDPTSAQQVAEVAAEMAWVKAMLPFLKQTVPAKQTTVSIADTGVNTVASRVAHFEALVTALGPNPPLDFFDCHFYGSADQAEESFVEWKQIAGTIPVACSETGQSTAIVTELTQAHYLGWVVAAARQEGMAVGVWTLNDFPWLTGRQSAYGVEHPDGTPKLAAAAVRTAYA